MCGRVDVGGVGWSEWVSSSGWGSLQPWFDSDVWSQTCWHYNHRQKAERG